MKKSRHMPNFDCIKGAQREKHAPEKTLLPGIVILDEEDPDPPHHCPRCDI